MALLINDNTPRVQYTASASQTVFAYPFAIFEDADLKVYLTPTGSNADDSSDILVLTTNYTVSGAGTTAGGNVTLVVAATSGDIITISRDIAVERTTDYQNLGDLASSSFNDDFDKTVMMIQQNESQLARTFKVQDTDSDITDFDFPLPVAGAYLRYNATKTGLEAGSLPTTLNGEVTAFDTIAALQGIASATNGDLAQVYGYYARGDGGGGEFYWDATSTDADNGGTIIKATAITTGRWVRVYSGAVDVKWFGAKGDDSTNDVTAIQAAIDSGASTVFFPSGNYVISTTTLTLEANQQLLGESEFISVIKITGAWTTSKAITGTDKANIEIRHLGFEGVTHTSTAPVIYLYNSGAAILAGPTIEFCRFSNFSSAKLISVDGVVTDADWLTYTEPASTWKVFDGVKINNITFKDNVVPVSDYGEAQVNVTAVKNLFISNIITEGCEERGIAVGYATDIVIADCQINTNSNANVNSNAHGVYLRTAKRFSINNVNVAIDADDSSYAIRLSRGAYYGDITGCTGVGLVAGTAGGLGLLGANDTVVTGCYFKVKYIACLIAGHGSVSGTDGTANSSYADASNIIIADSYFESDETTEPTLYAYALGVAGTEPRQPYVKNVEIKGCTFTNNAAADKIALLAIGDHATVSDCKFYGDDVWAGIEVNRNTRIASADFAWDIENCKFFAQTETTASSASSPYGAEFTTIGIIFYGNGSDYKQRVTNCDFNNWYCGVGINNGTEVLVKGNSFVDHIYGVKTDGASSTDVFIDGNDFNLTTAGSEAISIAVTNTSATTYSHISHNVFDTETAIRFSGGAETTYKLLNISQNTSNTTSRFIRDCPNIATVKITHNLSTEGTASTLPANPIDQFNYGIT